MAKKRKTKDEMDEAAAQLAGDIAAIFDKIKTQPTDIGKIVKSYKNNELGQKIDEIIDEFAKDFQQHNKQSKVLFLTYIGYGNTITASAEKAKIVRQTHNRWLKEDVKYKEAYEAVKFDINEKEAEEARSRLAQSASMCYNLFEIIVKSGDTIGALGYLHHANFIDNRIIDRHLEAQRYKEELEMMQAEEQGSDEPNNVPFHFPDGYKDLPNNLSDQ